MSLTARRSNQSILKEITPEHSLEGWMLNWSSNVLVPWCKELTIFTEKENKLPNYMQQDNAIAGLQDRSSAPHQLASLISLSENLKLLHTPLSPFSIHKKGGLAMNEWNSKQRDQLFQRKSVAVLKLMGQSSASIIPACLQNVPKAVLYQRKVYLNGFTTASEHEMLFP